MAGDDTHLPARIALPRPTGVGRIRGASAPRPPAQLSLFVDVAGDWFVERLRPGRFFERDLERWKRLQADGWDLVVLHERPSGDVVAFGYLPGKPLVVVELEMNGNGLSKEEL